MRFKQFIQEAKWKKIPIRRTTGRRDVWTYDKYELHKETDGSFTMYDITQKGDSPNTYKKIGSYSSLKKAKESINEYSGGTPVSQVMYGNYGAEVRRAPKTGKSLDYIHRTSGQGIVAPMEIYYDELDPRNRKKKRQKKWLSMYSRLM